MSPSYDAPMVVLSILIAVLASYSALDLAGRARGAAAAYRPAWLGMAAVVMGGGIWAMHFIGMLALRMDAPAGYGVGGTVASLLVAIAATGAAFALVDHGRARTRRVLPAGLLMGGGVAAMHYTGMAAMRMQAVVSYDGAIVAASVMLAVAASTAALWLALRTRGVGQKLLAAAVMGFAVYGMHYCGMLAATFTPADASPADTGLDGLPAQSLALYIAGATFLILFLALLASSIDQARVQRALLASEKRFRAAAEVVGDIIWTAGRSGQMQGDQPDWERFTGQSAAQYGGSGWTAAIHPDDVAATQAAWQQAVATGAVFLHEHRVRRQDGTYRLFAVRAAPVLDELGVLGEWVGVHEDITERRLAEDELHAAKDAAEEANRAKSQFLANMSHELRTPLSAIIGYSEMVDEDLQDRGDPAGVAGDVGKIQSNARHLLGLINDVLDLSKIESGKMEVYAERFDAAELVREVAATAETLMGKRRNTLAVEVAPGLGTMHQDVTKLRQMLLNLLSNADKFTEAGRVSLCAWRVADDAVFTVTDTGIGMTAEQIGRLFQRFQQADASTTRRFGGTGLGLAITQSFCSMLGGTIDVASTPGQCTTFTLRLPTVWHPVAAGQTLEPPSAAPASDEGASLDDAPLPANSPLRRAGDLEVAAARKRA